jgi:hypothetical protein
VNDKVMTAKMNKPVAQALIQMAQHDLTVRERLLKENKLSDGYNPEMEWVHKENAARLKEIIDLIGWPTRTKVGKDASEAAWLIVQHAIGEPAFMKRCYALLMESMEDINPQNAAYLYDRICYFEGRPQKYGTQYDDGGLYPVENKKETNALRQKLQLKPLPDHTIVEYQKSESGDLHKDTGFNAWRKKVRWIST